MCDLVGRGFLFVSYFICSSARHCRQLLSFFTAIHKSYISAELCKRFWHFGEYTAIFCLKPLQRAVWKVFQIKHLIGALKEKKQLKPSKEFSGGCRISF